MWVILVEAAIEKVGTVYDAKPFVHKILVEGLRSLTLGDLLDRDPNEDEAAYGRRLCDKIFDQGTKSLTDEDRQVDNFPRLGRAGYLELEVMYRVLEDVPNDESAQDVAMEKARAIAPAITEEILKAYSKYKHPEARLPCHQLRLRLYWLPDDQLFRFQELSVSQ